MSDTANILQFLIVMAFTTVMLRRRGWSLHRLAILDGVAIVGGSIWALIAISGSQEAMLFVGVLSGVAFVLLFMSLRKWRR